MAVVVYLDLVEPHFTAAHLCEISEGWRCRCNLWEDCLHDWVELAFDVPHHSLKMLPGVRFERDVALRSIIEFADVKVFAEHLRKLELDINGQHVMLNLGVRAASRGMLDPKPLENDSTRLDLSFTGRARINAPFVDPDKPILFMKIEAGKGLREWHRHPQLFREQINGLFERLKLDVGLDPDCPRPKFVAGPGIELHAHEAKWDMDIQARPEQGEEGLEEFGHMWIRFQDRTYYDVVRYLPEALELIAEEPMEIRWTVHGLDAGVSEDIDHFTGSDEEYQEVVNRRFEQVRAAQLPGRRVTLDTWYRLSSLAGLDYLSQFLAPNATLVTPLAEFSLPDRHRVLLQAFTEASGHQLAIRSKHELQASDLDILAGKIGVPFHPTPAKKIKGVWRCHVTP